MIPVRFSSTYLRLWVVKVMMKLSSLTAHGSIRSGQEYANLFYAATHRRLNPFFARAVEYQPQEFQCCIEELVELVRGVKS